MLISFLLSSAAMVTQFPEVHIGKTWSVFATVDESAEVDEEELEEGEEAEVAKTRRSWYQIGATWEVSRSRSREYGDLTWVVLTEFDLGSGIFGVTAAYGFRQSYDLGPAHESFFVTYGVQVGPSFLRYGSEAMSVAGSINTFFGPEWRFRRGQFGIQINPRFRIGHIPEEIGRWSKSRYLSAQLGINLQAGF